MIVVISVIVVIICDDDESYADSFLPYGVYVVFCGVYSFVGHQM